MRINKYIAQAGVASRRKADELIENGNVRGALGFAGGGAGGDHVGAVGTVVHVVIGLFPHAVPEFVRAHIAHDRLRGAELLPQLQGVHLAIFHALAAGHAVLLIDLGDKV